MVEAGGRLVAAGAFELRAPLGRRGPRVGFWLGDGPLVFAPDLLTSADARSACSRIFDEILGAAHAVLLGPAALQGPAVAAALTRAPAGRYEHHIADYTATRLPPAGLARLRRRVSASLRRADRDAATVTIEVRREPDEVAPALERLFELHRERWAGRAGAVPRFGASEAQRAWYRSTVRVAAARGTARVVEVFEGRTLVAAALGLLHGSGSLFHTTATRVGGVFRHPGHAALLAWVEEAAGTGATTMILGSGLGDPAGPKAALWPGVFPVGFVLAAASPAWDALIGTAFSARWRRRQWARARRRAR